MAEPRRRCLHLERLAEAARGLPLGPAAGMLEARGRGRHGNALQWHFGLELHDARPEPDWEGRIEIKLVSVWRRPDGRLACDRNKICEASLDPWIKLANVLFVFTDRLTRVVLGHRFVHLAGERLDRLARAWTQDPHFERPDLVVESRETRAVGPRGRPTMAPAYYLSARWFEREGLLPAGPVAIGHRFDPAWWTRVRREHANRDPLITLARAGAGEPSTTPCPRCQGRLRVDLEQVRREGWAPAIHTMPLSGACALRGHAVVDAGLLPMPAAASEDEQIAGIESWLPERALWRLADRIPEPDDHGH
ncbi:hypothetical protein ACNOYE_25390 [Nannocystaceae bacterium ST9]